MPVDTQFECESVNDTPVVQCNSLSDSATDVEVGVPVAVQSFGDGFPAIQQPKNNLEVITSDANVTEARSSNLTIFLACLGCILHVVDIALDVVVCIDFYQHREWWFAGVSTFAVILGYFSAWHVYNTTNGEFLHPVFPLLNLVPTGLLMRWVRDRNNVEIGKQFDMAKRLEAIGEASIQVTLQTYVIFTKDLSSVSMSLWASFITSTMSLGIGIGTRLGPNTPIANVTSRLSTAFGLFLNVFCAILLILLSNVYIWVAVGAFLLAGILMMTLLICVGEYEWKGLIPAFFTSLFVTITCVAPTLERTYVLLTATLQGCGCLAVVSSTAYILIRLGLIREATIVLATFAGLITSICILAFYRIHLHKGFMRKEEIRPQMISQNLHRYDQLEVPHFNPPSQAEPNFPDDIDNRIVIGLDDLGLDPNSQNIF